MGYRQVGKAQDFDSCISLVRVQLSQPKQKAPAWVPFVLACLLILQGILSIVSSITQRQVLPQSLCGQHQEKWICF